MKRITKRKNAAETRPGDPCAKCGCKNWVVSSGKCHECTKAKARERWAVRYSKRTEWATILLANARRSSKRRGHPAPTITVSWIKEQFEAQGKCWFTGVQLIPPTHDTHAKLRCPWAPSLDRIDNAKGYTPENTRVTSWFWNNFRGDLPEDVAFEHLHQMARCIVWGRCPKTAKKEQFGTMVEQFAVLDALGARDSEKTGVS